MDYHKTAQLCHALEDVLDAIKRKKVKPDKFADILFECFDTLEVTLKRLKEGKQELDTTKWIQALQALITTGGGQSTSEETTVDRETKEARSVSSIVEKITSIEVKVETLDLLMNLAEALLINKMRLDRIKEDLQSPELTAAVDTLARLISDVQYNIMQARMVPIGFVFNRFPRMVRDLAKQQKKQVNLEMEGTEIGLDRSIIDEIGECLVHLIRNAIDHGIEKPQERKKADKPPQGTVTLTATRTKNSAIIQIADDGAGIDFEKTKDRATERGILSAQASEDEVMNSLFSGLSTTDHVTSVSGRGFGLNIVKNRMESLGGTIQVESSRDKGATFEMELPLTLAVIHALFVEVSDSPYAIPLSSVDRLVTVNKGDIKGMLSSEAVVVDEEDVVLKRLDVLFGAPSRVNDSQAIAIVRKGNEKVGLTVDSFLGTEEIVIKPLTRLLRENKYFSGTTITGSGDVVPILDVETLATAEAAEESRGRRISTAESGTGEDAEDSA
jgi:two-component system chemotaxis sensor kinase CheA